MLKTERQAIAAYLGAIRIRVTLGGKVYAKDEIGAPWKAAGTVETIRAEMTKKEGER